jgi:hypothetical protein
MAKSEQINVTVRGKDPGFCEALFMKMQMLQGKFRFERMWLDQMMWL